MSGLLQKDESAPVSVLFFMYQFLRQYSVPQLLLLFDNITMHAVFFSGQLNSVLHH